MVIISIVLLIWPEFLVKIFSTEPELVALTSSFLRIAVVGYLVFSFIAIPKHCLTGAGDTIPAMIIELAHVFLVMIPFAYILTKFTNLGVYGVRWAIVIGMSAGGLAYFFYFLTGKWKHKKV